MRRRLISIGDLAAGVRTVVPDVRADVFTSNVYKDLQSRHAEQTPEALLQRFISLGFPGIVRLGGLASAGHYNVVTAFDTEGEGTYTANGVYGKVIPRGAADFMQAWSNSEPNAPYETANLMLVIRPQ